MSSVKIARADAVALCVALGFKTAGKWNRQRMMGKLNELAAMAADGSGIEVEEGTEDGDRLNEILAEIMEAGGDIDLVKEAEPKEEASEAAAEPEVKKPKGKKAKKVELAEEEEPEEEEEEEEEEKPAAKAGKKKSAGANGKAKSGAGPEAKAAGVRSLKNRRFIVGTILKKHGLDGGITDKLIALVNKAYGDENDDASRKQLADGWHVLNGYLNG